MINKRDSWILTLVSLIAGILFAVVGVRLMIWSDWVSGIIYLITGMGCLVYAYIGYRVNHKGW